MIPDMKRLCEAAEMVAEREGLAFPFATDQVAMIIRAVLEALKDPSDDALARGAVDLIREVADPWDVMTPEMEEAFGLDADGPGVWAAAEERIRPNVRRAFAAMIDQILAP